MKTVILCGGQGSRIRDVNEVLPKPLLPIGGKPIVWHIMKSYAAHGINDFVLCLGYKGWMIKEFFLNYRAMTNDLVVHLGSSKAVEVPGQVVEENWKVTLAETGEHTQTGGRLAAIRKYVQDEKTFCLTYGDGVADVDIKKLIAFHESHGKIATVTATHPPGRFGEMQMEGAVVREFNEKPQVSTGFINGGFFVLNAKRLWKYLSGGPMSIWEREPLQSLAADGELVAFEHRGFFQPMDTSREFKLLNELWEAGKAPWKVW